MNIIFLGQKPIAEKIFFSIITNDNIKNIYVCSNKQKNNWWKSNKIYQYCKINQIHFIDNKKRNEAELEKIIFKKKIKFIFSIQHKWIISKKIIDLVNGNAFNLHLCTLPDYRGSCGINLAILHKKKYINATLHYIIPEVDMGPVVFEEKVKIEKNDNAFSLYGKLEEKGYNVFLKLFSHIIKGKKIPKNYKNGTSLFGSYKSLDKYRVLNYNQKNINDQFLYSKALNFKPFKPLIIKNNNQNFYLTPEITETKTQKKFVRVSSKIINTYKNKDEIKKLLKKKETPLEKKLYCQKWLHSDLSKRYTYFKIYYDLLKKNNLKILDVGGGLSSITKIMSVNHRYTICEIFNYDQKKQIEYFSDATIYNGDWFSYKFEKYDLIIANDIFPNADQRLELFLIKSLPHCKKLRLTITIDNDENFYTAKRLDGNEILTQKRMNGESVYYILKKFIKGLNESHLEELSYNEDSSWNNKRQVFTIEINGYLT